ncbi:MAG: DNA-3-methyladenine glycosylase I [Nitrososphaerales archaeon]
MPSPIEPARAEAVDSHQPTIIGRSEQRPRIASASIRNAAGREPIQNTGRMTVTALLSEWLWKVLKRGFKSAGPFFVCAWMQASGIVNHPATGFRRSALQKTMRQIGI